MEVFKYITEEHLQRIKSRGALEPRKADGIIYGIPEDPLLWAEHTEEIFDQIIKDGVSPIVLIKFTVDDNDPDAAVQDGDDWFWDKRNNRHPIAEYVREDYRLPEVIVRKSIPFEEISIVDSYPLISA